MAPELEAGQQEVAGLQVVLALVSLSQVGGGQEDGREEELEPGLPVTFVHLEHEFLHTEEGAGRVGGVAVLDEVSLQVVHRDVQHDAQRPELSQVLLSLRLAALRPAHLSLAVVHRGELLVLPEQILLDVHEVPDESPVEEGDTGSHLQVHLAQVGLEGCGVERVGGRGRLTVAGRQFSCQRPQWAQQTGLLVRGGDVSLGGGAGCRAGVVLEVYRESQTGHTPAVNPACRVLTPPPPLSFLQTFLPDVISVPAHYLGRVVQREEDVVAGVGVGQVDGQVQSLPGHEELEGDDLGEELCVGKTEVQRQEFTADGEVGILRVVARGVDPVELIGCC